jgi:hypothetical protein
MPKTTQYVPVTERALVQRINRALAKAGRHGHIMKKTRGMSAQLDLGRFYVLDIDRNFVVRSHVDLESLGRQLEVFHAYEVLAE